MSNGGGTKTRVVVTGLGAITPIGHNVPTYWQNLLAGVSGAGPITGFDTTHYRTKFACEVKDFDPLQYLDRKEARKLDRFTQFGMVAAEEAIAHAGLVDNPKVDKSRVGVILGSGIGGMQVFTEEMGAYFGQENARNGESLIPRFNPFFVPRMIVDILAGHVSIKYGFSGPNYACVSACATSTHCLIDAYMLIQNGLADVVVAGGAEAAITEPGIGGFSAMKALSERNDDPATASRPFDKDRDGFVLGEGGAALVLESEEHARKRGAQPLAELAGIALNGDAHHITAPHPEGEGIGKLLSMVVKNAGLSPADVQHVNLHATSTPLGDKGETKAVKLAFGDHAPKLALTSTKSMIGHLLGAAGAVEAIATVMAVQTDTVHPTINHFTDDPDCDLDYTFHNPRQMPVEVAISTNYGFGGHNAAVLFRKIR